MKASDQPPHVVTRFAPSPTGRLHLGHGWSALMAHDLARSTGGQFRLRIEDIDGVRSRPEHVEAILEDLRWLGLDWDGPVVFQSARLPTYDFALARLKAKDLVYPCFCTRADIKAEIAASLSAPHGSNRPLYPGTCRRLNEAERAERLARDPHGWRLDVKKAAGLGGPLQWKDEMAGIIDADPLSAGDVILARKDAPTSYHLAATIDDAEMAVTHIVRGQDLFAATHVHRLLQALLDLPTPVYRHHPLLLGQDGMRLAKRNGGQTLFDLRKSGTDAARLKEDLRRGIFPIGIALADA